MGKKETRPKTHRRTPSKLSLCFISFSLISLIFTGENEMRRTHSLRFSHCNSTTYPLPQTLLLLTPDLLECGREKKACWPRDALANNQGNWEINGRMGTGSTRAEDEITISMLEQITDQPVILAAAGKIGSLGTVRVCFNQNPSSGPIRRNRNVRLRGSGSDFSFPCHCLRHCTGSRSTSCRLSLPASASIQ